MTTMSENLKDAMEFVQQSDAADGNTSSLRYLRDAMRAVIQGVEELQERVESVGGHAIVPGLRRRDEAWAAQTADGPGEQEHHIDLIGKTDALLWAREFIRTVRNHPERMLATDEGTMLGWFASAIGSGEMAQHKRTQEAKKQTERYHAELIRLKGEVAKLYSTHCGPEPDADYPEFGPEDGV